MCTEGKSCEDLFQMLAVLSPGSENKIRLNTVQRNTDRSCKIFKYNAIHKVKCMEAYFYFK